MNNIFENTQNYFLTFSKILDLDFSPIWGLENPIRPSLMGRGDTDPCFWTKINLKHRRSTGIHPDFFSWTRMMALVDAISLDSRIRSASIEKTNPA